MKGGIGYMETKKKEMTVLPVKFIGRSNEQGNIMTLKFEVPEGFSWTEGSHLHMAFNDFIGRSGPDKSKVRALSIMSHVNESFIGVTTRIQEDGSAYKRRLLDLEEGDEMLMFKVGNRMELKRVNRPLVLISMGIGMATFRPLILEYNQNAKGVNHLISLNVDSGGSFLYREKLDSLNIKGFYNHYAGSRKELYKMMDQCLESDDAIYYVVGSDAFLKKIIGYLKEKQIAESDIVIDKKPELRLKITEG